MDTYSAEETKRLVWENWNHFQTWAKENNAVYTGPYGLIGSGTTRYYVPAVHFYMTTVMGAR